MWTFFTVTSGRSFFVIWNTVLFLVPQAHIASVRIYRTARYIANFVSNLYRWFHLWWNHYTISFTFTQHISLSAQKIDKKKQPQNVILRHSMLIKTYFYGFNSLLKAICFPLSHIGGFITHRLTFTEPRDYRVVFIIQKRRPFIWSSDLIDFSLNFI